MGIGDAIILVACLGGLLLATPALLVFFNVIFVDVVGRTTRRLHNGLVFPLVLGVGVAFLVGVPAAWLASLGSVPQLIGVVVFFLLLAWAFLGVAGVARLVGKRMTTFNAQESTPFIEATSGAFVLCLAFSFPIVGWFVLLPGALLAGLGGMTLAVVRRHRWAVEPDASNIAVSQPEAISS